jgi:hypothetical protein
MVGKALWLKMAVAANPPKAGFAPQRSDDLPLMKSQQTHPGAIPRSRIFDHVVVK